jgi:hypothetical protein
MVTTSITNIKEIFSDDMFSRGSRPNSEGYEVFPIVRPDGRINPIIIQGLMVATRNGRPLYFISGWNLPSMDAGEVEKEVIKEIMECLVWENIK